MTIQQINIGSSPKGEGGDTWRGGSEKLNANFQSLDERTTLAQQAADSKTANETDEFLLGRENHTGSQPIATIDGLQDALDSASATDIIAKAAIPSSQKGMANGVATLDSSGVIPTNQLPSYVDDVLEFATFSAFPATGETGKIYISIETGKTYRWTGTVYVAIGGAETADTALRLFSPRTIAISGGATGTATQFDGSANIIIPITEVDAAKITKGIIPAERIPTLNQSTTGNAATATKLATPRKINGVGFDGTVDINLDVYNKSEVDTAIANATPVIPGATETVAGKAKIATTAIAQAGVNDTDFITAKKLRNALNVSGNAPMYACRAWVNFNGTGAVTIRASGNVSSITDNGNGDYTVNFTIAMQDALYIPFLSHTGRSGDTFKLVVTSATEGGTPTLKTASAIRVNYGNIDLSEVYIGIIR